MDANVLRCPTPGASRCLGFDALTFTQRCARGYQGFQCSACAKGFYSTFDESSGGDICVRCKGNEGRYLPVLYFFIGVIGFTVLLALGASVVGRELQASMLKVMARGYKSVFFLLLCAQYLIQVGSPAKRVPNLPVSVRTFLSGLEVLQFSRLAAPSQCVNQHTFKEEIVQMGLILGAITALIFLTLFWVFVSDICSLGRPRNRSTRNARQAISSILDVLEKLFDSATYRMVSFMIISVLFALVCNTALGLINCGHTVQMRVSDYLGHTNDGSALVEAGISCGAHDPLCRFTVPSTGVLAQLVSASLVSSYPQNICREGDHKPVYILAVFTLCFLVAVYPVVSFALLNNNLNFLLKPFWRSQMDPEFDSGGKNDDYLYDAGLTRDEHAVRHWRRNGPWCWLIRPCSRWRQSCCVRYGLGLCIDFSEADRTPSNDRVTLMLERRIVDSMECIAEVDGDPYFTPQVSKTYVPTGFYFVYLHQFVLLVLSLSGTYLNGPREVWWRLGVNSVAILGLCGLLLTSEPYRKNDTFSAHAQISMLLVAYIITLAGVSGSASAPVELDPSIQENSAIDAAAVFGYMSLVAISIAGVSLLWSFVRSLQQAAMGEYAHTDNTVPLMKFLRNLDQPTAIAPRGKPFAAPSSSVLSMEAPQPGAGVHVQVSPLSAAHVPYVRTASHGLPSSGSIHRIPYRAASSPQSLVLQGSPVTPGSPRNWSMNPNFRVPYASGRSPFAGSPSRRPSLAATDAGLIALEQQQQQLNYSPHSSAYYPHP
jgi:hypothetical protein